MSVTMRYAIESAYKGCKRVRLLEQSDHRKSKFIFYALTSILTKIIKISDPRWAQCLKCKVIIQTNFRPVLKVSKTSIEFIEKEIGKSVSLCQCVFDRPRF